VDGITCLCSTMNFSILLLKVGSLAAQIGHNYWKASLITLFFWKCFASNGANGYICKKYV